MLLRQAHLRPACAFFGLSLVVTVYFLITRHGSSAFGSNAFSHHFDYKTHSTAAKGYAPELVVFWKALASSLEAARPRCPPIDVASDEMSAHDRSWEPLIEKTRPDRLNLSEEDETELMKKHRQMRIAAKRLGPALPVGKGTGIVTTGGPGLVPMLMVSLRMLRRTGCTLPVEVFLDDQEEYKAEADVCEKVLPTLNARCQVISDIYSEAANVTAPTQYQFKVLAILFSSFEHVLFLDADAFPAHDPTPLLSSAPYTTHGLVTWPGFYANAASAHFYHIASIPVPPVNRGTESGIILLNKEHHRQSLLMMVYYNYYGPEYYYPLQAQKGPGQGDKETFGAGAMAVQAPGPLYAVRTPVKVLGMHVDGKFIFGGAAQADPIEDYDYEPPLPNHILKDYEWNQGDKVGASEPQNKKARAFFVHTVSPETKLNPSKLLREGGLAYSADGNWRRIWGDEKWMLEHFGFDVEKRMWECVGEEACRTDRELCSEMEKFRVKVFGTSS